MRDEREELDAAVGDQAHEGCAQAQPIPAVLERGADPRDLRADDGDPVVVRLLSKVKLRRAALIEAHGHDAGGVGACPHGGVQRGVRARGLDADICPAPARQVLDQLRRGAGAAVDGGRACQALPKLQARRQQIDGDHMGAGEPRQLRDDLPDDAHAEDGDRLVQVDLRVEDAVKGDRADVREDAEDRLDVGRVQARPRNPIFSMLVAARRALITTATGPGCQCRQASRSLNSRCSPAVQALVTRLGKRR